MRMRQRTIDTAILGRDYVRALRRLAKRSPGRPSDADGIATVREEHRLTGVPLIDILRRHAAIALLESQGHNPPSDLHIADTVAQLKGTAGVPSIQRLRKQIRHTAQRLPNKRRMAE